MSRSRIATVCIGLLIAVIVALSEFLSSSANGIGPYQGVLLALGLLIILIGILPADHWSQKIVLMLSSFMITLMLIEGVLLVLNRLNVDVTYPDVRELQDDPLLGKRTPDNAAGHDERGWRNLRGLENADIVAIGDSQTWGVNASITETYPNVLGDLTGKTVYSMAQGSYGAVQYRVLTEQAIDLSPDLVVVGMYFGNDLADAYTMVYGDYEAYATLRDPDFNYTAISQSIAEQGSQLTGNVAVNLNQIQAVNSAELSFVERVQSGTYIGKLLTSAGIFEVVDTGDMARQMEINRQIVQEFPDVYSSYQRDSIETFLTPAYRQLVIDFESPVIAEGIRITKMQYLDLAQTLQAEGIDLLIVLIPTKEFVYLPYVVPENISEVYTLLGEQEQQVRQEMIGLFQENGIDFVDTLPALRQAVEGNLMIYPPTFDGHPSATGYRVIAETIAQYIQVNNMVN